MNANAYSLVRAVRGPILLIAFGTLMALNHTQRMDIERTWPVLIILYGVFKLLERMIGQPLPPPGPPYSPTWQQPGGSPAGPYVGPVRPATPYPPPPYSQPYPPQTPEGGAQ